MTQTGTQMGTPVYMSPEQVKAEKTIDHRSDIYSLGVTLFFAINGKPPYDSATDSQFHIFNKIVFEPLPETNLQNPFRGIIEKACQKNREDRFQTCEEWLRSMKSGMETGKGQAGKRKTSPKIKSDESKPRENVKGERKLQKDATPDDLSTILVEPSGKVVAPLTKPIGNKKASLVESFPFVKIGSQIWMAEDLKVKKFRNGEKIKHAQSDAEWKNAFEKKIPAWCYMVDKAIKSGTTILYNLWAQNDERGLAPEGWKIPSQHDWDSLFDKVIAKELKATTGWRIKNNWFSTKNFNGNNLSGFGAKPTGFRYNNGALSVGSEVAESAFYFCKTMLKDSEGMSLQKEYGTPDDLYLVAWIGESAVCDVFSSENQGWAIRCIKE
jgi:uncharacterized protein (TIGR02145 family)